MPKSNPKPFVIGVAGGSGSGKSTVTRQVLAAIGTDKVAVVMQDDYYRDQSHMPPQDRRKQNYDHPDAFDWPLMTQHLAALRKGEAIAMPVYDFAADNRSTETVTVKPAPVIVVEGLFALYDNGRHALKAQSTAASTPRPGPGRCVPRPSCCRLRRSGRCC